MREIVPGIQMWSAFSEEMGMNFNGYAVETSKGTVLIDPPDPRSEGWSSLDTLAPFEGIFVTNRNHSRAAAAFRDQYGVPVRVHVDDSEQAVVDADETVRGGETIAGEIKIINVPGKSPGEIAFYVPAKRALIVGDLVIGVPPGELGTYPAEFLDDVEELYRSAEKLLELDFDALLLCDGEPVLVGGKELLRRFVEERARAGATS